jgi:cytochrome b561
MEDRYAPVQKLLHWLVVLFLLVQVPLGVWIAVGVPKDEALATQIYQAHDGNGAVILVLALIWLGFRKLLGTPVLPRGTPLWVDSLASFTHRAIYLVLIVQPLTGWLANGAAGHPWAIYNLYTIPSPIAKNEQVAEWLSTAHQGFAGLLAALVLLHLLGVAYHGLIRRDGVAGRIV